MEEPRIGVYICWCGTNISKMVDVEAIAEDIGKMPDVTISRDYKYMCSDPGQDLIIKDIKEHKLTRVVVSACSPRIHEITFRKALEKAGLNPYLFEMANIREQVSWVHTDRELATEKAKSLVIAAINKVKFYRPLEKRTVDINPDTLIIGAGVSGLSAALDIAESGFKVYLIEKGNELGGVVSKIDLTFPHMSSAQQIITSLRNRVENNENIEIFLNTEVSEINGYIGNFVADVSYENSIRELRFGNIILATGLKPTNPENIHEFGYGRHPDVVTALEFEQMLINGNIKTKEGKEPKDILIIHCVGSRNENYNPYCSRTCCMTALKFSNQIRSALPSANIYQAYSDMRAFGKGCEEFYAQTGKKNVMFLMYDQKKGIPTLRKSGWKDKCSMIVHLYEKLSHEDIEIPADMVILMVSMEAHENVKDVAHAAGVSLDSNGFFMEKHPKLDPVATTTDGVYIAGSCQSPKDITDSVSQARATAAKVITAISVGKVEVESITSEVNQEICCGCQTCISVCPYSAVSFDEEKNVSFVNEILCKGCGTCSSACPTGAIRAKHFSDRQILAQIDGLMSVQNEKTEKFEIEEV